MCNVASPVASGISNGELIAYSTSTTSTLNKLIIKIQNAFCYRYNFFILHTILCAIRVLGASLEGNWGL